jgi:aryl-alcohol dehydrogenase-like predicted oxidoreductase
LTDFIPFFRGHNIGIINASPLSMGLLSERGVPDWHPAPRPLVEACHKAMLFCKEHNYPIEQLAIQYAISNPLIATTLFSSANPENVARNLRYADTPIDWNLVDEVHKIIGPQLRVSWKNT